MYHLGVSVSTGRHDWRRSPIAGRTSDSSQPARRSSVTDTPGRAEMGVRTTSRLTSTVVHDRTAQQFSTLDGRVRNADYPGRRANRFVLGLRSHRVPPPHNPRTEHDQDSGHPATARSARVRVSRRAVLATVPAVVGGCTEVGFGQASTPTTHADRDDDGVPDQADDYPNDPDRAFESGRSHGTTTIEPGEFAAGNALTNHPDDRGDILHYEVSVDGDALVDCLVFRRDAWDAYAGGARDVPVVDQYSRVGVSDANVTEQLAAGEFLFAIDNTGLLTDPTATSVDVTYTVTVAAPPPTSGAE